MGTKFKSYKVDFDQNRIDLWQNAATVVVRAGLVITEEGVTEQNIQYFDRYRLKVQLATRVDFKTIKKN